MRITAFALGLAALFAAPAPANAQQMIAQYYALLSPQDFYNSNGMRLSGFCAILQQDRANYHRFGNRDELDDWDPVFGNPDARAQLGQVCRLAPGNEYIANAVARGETRFVYVEIYGSGGWPSTVVAYEGAG